MKKGGYQGVLLKTPEKFKGVLVHRLVAEAFIPNPDNLPQVNHKNENKWNNCVETGLVYPTLHEASRQTGINVQNISMCCRGTVYSKRNGFTQRHTAGGHHWEYTE